MKYRRLPRRLQHGKEVGQVGHGVALAMAEKLNEAAGEVKYAVASAPHYEKYVVKMVEKINMMSGLPYMEASNTPSYCSPASESYWSM